MSLSQSLSPDHSHSHALSALTAAVVDQSFPSVPPPSYAESQLDVRPSNVEANSQSDTKAGPSGSAPLIAFHPSALSSAHQHQLQSIPIALSYAAAQPGPVGSSAGASGSVLVYSSVSPAGQYSVNLCPPPQYQYPHSYQLDPSHPSFSSQSSMVRGPSASAQFQGESYHNPIPESRQLSSPSFTPIISGFGCRCSCCFHPSCLNAMMLLAGIASFLAGLLVFIASLHHIQNMNGVIRVRYYIDRAVFSSGTANPPVSYVSGSKCGQGQYGFTVIAGLTIAVAIIQLALIGYRIRLLYSLSRMPNDSLVPKIARCNSLIRLELISGASQCVLLLCGWVQWVGTCVADSSQSTNATDRLILDVAGYWIFCWLFQLIAICFGQGLRKLQPVYIEKVLENRNRAKVNVAREGHQFT